jgi:single-strand DNA-binding protein
MNKVFLMGRLGGDPVQKDTKTGKKVVTFSLATSRKSKDRGEVTQWHHVVTWGVQAEHCMAYLKKGQSVLVEGTIRTNRYTGKDGVERQAVDVYADDISFLSFGKRTLEETMTAEAEQASDGESLVHEEVVDIAV